MKTLFIDMEVVIVDFMQSVKFKFNIFKNKTIL